VVDYGFSFNGKERDNETYGEGNAFDFGERIYDPRLGRLPSIDPLYKKFVNESNYSFAGNCPIFLVDRNGEKKTTYITILNEDNTTTRIKIVEKDMVKKVFVPTSVFGISTHDYSIVNYDITENIIVDNTKGKGIKVSTTTYQERGAFSFIDDLVETNGGKTKVGGGIVLTSSKGQGGETKIAEANFSIENIDNLLGTIGAGKSGAGNVGIPKMETWAKLAKGFTQLVKRLNSSAKIGSSISKQTGAEIDLTNSNKKVVCGNCNDTMDIDKVDSWHPESDLDTIETPNR
jgi:RHS repeat-associated protein